MKFRKLTVLAILLIISSIVFPVISNAAVLLSDSFTGTTINASNWTEVDGSGIGGTTGNMQQNGSLTMTGGATWGSNYVVTVPTYNRSLGGLEMEADVTCTDGTSIFGIGYGDPGVLSGGGESYTLYAVGNSLYFSRQSGNANVENNSNIGSCPSGTPVHVRITVGTTTGASVYLNGSGTPASTVTGGTFNNKGFFLSGHSGAVTTVDNFVVNGASAATAPDAPTGLTATPSSTQMALSWTAPANNGAAITDYVIQYKLASEPTTWTTFADGTSAATTALVTGLTNGLSYNFRVSATNSAGTGPVSTTATATPALSVPTAPLSLVTSVGTSAQVGLSWGAPVSNGGASITDYKIEYKLSSEPTTWTVFTDGVSTGTSTSVTGLTNGLSYDFRVSAINSVGAGAVSSTATATPSLYSLFDDFTGTTINTSKWNEVDVGGLGGTVGNVRQNGYITNAGIGSWTNQNGLESVQTFDRTNGDVSFTLTITRDTCGSGVGPVAMGYGDLNIAGGSNASYILLSNTNNWELYYWNGGANVSGSGGAASPQVLSGFTSCTNGVPFTLTLKALQAGGASVYVNGSLTPSATITTGTFTNKSVWIGTLSAAGVTQYDNATVLAPLDGPFPVTDLAATPNNGQVDLSWTAPDSNGSAITDYTIQYKLNSSGSWSTFADGTSNSTGATVTGLTNGSLYNFRVYAINGNGTSDASNIVNATPLNTTPTAPTASSVSISGNAAISDLLTGSYTYNDVNGNAETTSTFRWLRSDTLGGTYSAISGATSLVYTPVTADLNKYLKFEVTPVTSVSPTTGTAVLSSAVGPVAAEVPYVNLILSTGQSLSVGINSSPALSTTQPYTNKMLNGGNGGIGMGTSLIPLVESGVETISSSMANTITANVPGNAYQVAVGLHGVSGYTYSQLKKGTGPYSNGMTQVTNVKNAATGLGKSTRVVGVTTIHGETDNLNGVTGPQYESMLEEWQNDYETDSKAITGQSSHVPLFTDQMSSFMAPYAFDATSEIPIYQLKASEDNVGLIYLVAPKYFFNYSDLHHLTGASSRWLGEYYGKVMKKVLVDGDAWRPLSPDSATRSGNIIYAKFHVPAGQLAFDTTLVSSRTNKGFEYYDSTSSASITNVEIISTDTVKVTLSGTPSGSNQRLRYAYTGIPGTNSGAQNAGTAAGNLRDTDPYPSAYGNTLYNWAVHFDQPITVDSTAPVISSVLSTPATTSASITWNTDEASSSIVDYGLLTSYGTSTAEIDTTIGVTNHIVSIPGLIACTTYHYRVRSKDAVLNIGTGFDNTFTTSGCTASASIESQGDIEVTTSMDRSLSLFSSGKGITLDIPSSAVTMNTLFQIKKLDTTTVLGVTSLPSGRIVAGSYVYDLKALTGVGTAVTSFPAALTITISYGSSDVSGLTESSLAIYSWDGASWQLLTGCIVDTTAKTVTCNTNHFTVFGLFGTATIATPSSGGSSSGITSGSNPMLLAKLNTKTVVTATQTPLTTSIFTRNLKFGAKGEDVKKMQQFLNSKGFIIAKTGAGSKGKETTTFGTATKAALKKFQKANNLTPADGIFGPKTIKVMNSLIK